MQSCSGSLLRMLVLLFNLIFVVFGILVIVLGFLVYGQVVYFREVANFSVLPSVALILVGFVIFLVAFLACCGACTENYCMLMSFSAIVSLIVIVEITAAVFIYKYRRDIENVVVDGMESIIKNNGTNQQVVFDIQAKFECCGAKSYKDWDEERLEGPYPASCCRPDKKACLVPDFMTPCKDAIEREVSGIAKALVGVVCGFIGIQVLSMVFSCCLGSSIRKDYHRFV